MTAKEWRLSPSPPAGFAGTLGLPPFQAHLLYNRGIRRPEELEPYLSADSRLVNDPLLLPDMDRAVERLARALADDEVVGVFGDFDTDGVTGTALLVLALRDLGLKPIPYLPNRVDEGHGLNSEAVKSFQWQGVSLMVTVDCGSSSPDEVELASSVGIDTVITDHHSLPRVLPEAVALVNPGRPDSEFPYGGLTGAGLAYKLAEALYKSLGRPTPDYLVELAALGTVADVGPLTGENRHLVRAGLERINQTQHTGLRALIDRSGLKQGSLDTDSLAFALIPRLNAAGRLADATLSLELLLAPPMEKAAKIADELERHNSERRRLTMEGVTEAIHQVDRDGALPNMIFVGHESWLPGIVGLIASSLAERYHHPAVALVVGESVCRGSARSVVEFDIVDALRQCQGLFQRFGGHPQAAGFTLATADLPALKQELTSIAEEKLGNIRLAPSINVDCQISPALLDANLGFIETMAPFGEGNPAPVFLTRNARVTAARQVGSRGDHLKMRLAHSGVEWEAIAFRHGDRGVRAGDRLDLVYTVGLDDWGPEPTLQLTVQDLHVRR